MNATRQINKTKTTTKATMLKEKTKKINLVRTKMHNEHETKLFYVFF